jgi:hypothetical protein
MTATHSFVRRILLVLSGVAMAGIALAWWLRGTFAGQPDPRSTYSAFYVIFARGEPLGLAIVAFFNVAAAWLLIRRAPATASWPWCEKIVDDDQPHNNHFAIRPIVFIAVLVFAIAGLGTHLVCHDYPLSADEFMADFQAQIFLRGQISAEIPPQWLDAVRVIKPTHVEYFPTAHSWKATYLPVYAAMRAVFQSVHLQAFLNPCLAALTVLALYGAARNIWPNEKQNAFVAVLLLAGSAQFLVMAMTAYSMPAHLALNTVWLWLYSRTDRRRFYLAPIVGVLAIGLHQPIVHALFAAPFLCRLVIQRKWRAVSVFGLIYLLGCAGWYIWRTRFSPAPVGSAAPFFRLWNLKMLVIQPMDLLLVAGWSALATPLLVVLGFARFSRVRPIIQDAAISCLLTFGFYYFFYLDQGHGWGYRYFHGTLSCFVLVAVAGWEALVEKTGRRSARNFLFVALAASFLVALPLRFYQVETFIRPFARSAEAVQSMNAEVVGIDPHFAWYSADLIRNDPFLEHRPIVAALINLRPQEVATLTQAGKARFVTREELGEFGLATTSVQGYRSDPFHLGYGN